MLNFRQFTDEYTPEIYYLEESFAAKEGKNVHLEHLDDAIWNGGISGIVDAIQFIQSLRDMFLGVTPKHGHVALTTKWDGAPAIFAGTNPENGKFFVGTKGVFAKTPKLNYTNADIDRNHPGSGLGDKLKLALQYLPEIGIKGIIQGDMMFTQGDLKEREIDGEKMLTFHPNTIVYAIPANSALADQLRRAKLGIVWHTSYSGNTIKDLKASFKVNVGNLNPSRNVWFRDASLTDATDAATLSPAEAKTVTQYLSRIGTLLNKVDSTFVNSLAALPQRQIEIKAWNNANIRQMKSMQAPNSYVDGLINSVKARNVKPEVLMLYEKNRKQLEILFAIQNYLTIVKDIIVVKLQEIKSIGTFLQTPDGFKVSNPEGFVAVNSKGTVVKLINRLEFSHANFTATKEWK